MYNATFTWKELYTDEKKRYIGYHDMIVSVYEKRFFGWTKVATTTVKFKLSGSISLLF